ncbi:MAG: hypothetical protein KIS85_04225 [Anaerolineales bacterium]|nr:hypothetical protein [Anaerolineales bacterium]
MRVHANEKLYKRNIRLSFIASLLGMFTLVGSVYVLFGEGQFGLYLLFLILGIVLVQVGSWFSRWSRRADLALTKALSSLDNNYSLYHHRSPVAHLLVGPTGAWILMPRHTRGQVRYDVRRKRWAVKPPGLLARFGQEPVGRPVVEASLEAEAIDRFLQKHWPDAQLRIQAALVFMDESAEVEGVSAAPIPTASIKKLKQALQKGDSQSRLDAAQREKLNALLTEHYPAA